MHSRSFFFSGGELLSHYLKRVPLLDPLGFLAMADSVLGGGGRAGRREGVGRERSRAITNVSP